MNRNLPVKILQSLDGILQKHDSTDECIINILDVQITNTNNSNEKLLTSINSSVHKYNESEPVYVTLDVEIHI